MYKVLIVEDEIPVRDTIIEIVDWASLGLEVVFAAGDGQEALNYLDEHQVDLILTDIYMPYMNGMELVRQIRLTNRYCKVVFLTGYNEFDYAKEAVELNVSKYLLKPITKEELTKVLLEMKEELDETIEAKKNLSLLQMEYEKSRDFLREKFFHDIIEGFIPEDRITQSCEILAVDFDSAFYRVGVLEIVHKEKVGQKLWAEDYSLLHFALFNICKEILEDKTSSKVLLGQKGQIVIIFTSDKDQGFGDLAFDQLSEIMGTIRHIYQMPMTAGLSSTYTRLYDLQYAYDESLSAIDYSVIEGYNRVIVTSDVEPVTPMNRQKIDETMTAIVASLKVNKLQDAENLLTLFFEQLKFNRYALNEIKTLILSLATKVIDGYNLLCLNEAMKETLDFTLVEALQTMEDFTGVKKQLMETMKHLSNQLRKSRDNDKNQLVLEAIDYIQASYMNPSLDLKEMSEQLHVSASYFSRIFKQAREQTFLEYLTNYRLTQAKYLLKSTDMKVYEISMEVGYDDPHYFSYNFRKNVGKTPLKFRKA